MKHSRLLVTASVLTAVLTGVTTGASHAGIALDAAGKVSLYGDFRFRVESDWNSKRANGVARDDRDRARIRARFGFKVKPGNDMEFGVRYRTGSDDSQQSPHITVLDFNDNDTGDANVNLDKWYLKRKGGMLSGWVGRNSFPFWKQNELFWDDDVTPAGVALNYKSGAFAVNTGYFSLPVGMREFSGNLGAIQGVFKADFGGTSMKTAVGYYNFDSNPSDVDSTTLRGGNGARDYGIWVVSVQGKLKAGGYPLTLGADFMRNTKDYSVTDPDRNETNGYVLSAKWGKAKSKGDWQLGYYYAHIEKYAVNASYAQDDWIRWGSAVETDASDFKGHEFRFKYGLGSDMNMVARLYIVEALTSVQDGNRFRVDFNYKF